MLALRQQNVLRQRHGAANLLLVRIHFGSGSGSSRRRHS
jgi:hypothetical protein